MIKHSKPTIDRDELKKISDILISGNHSTKEIVRKFERKLSSFVGVRGGVATNSGTSALHLALLSLDIKREDEVIIPSFVCTSILNAVNYIEAKPILVDVDEDTFNMSYKSVLRKITKNTKAIIIPHMFGLPINIKSFLDLGIYVIEDGAQSLGAKKVGSQGHVSIFSFYATKLISTGYGGMLVSNSKRILKRADDLLNVDERKDYKLRFNYNMTDFQAMLGISQLDRLTKFIEKRKKIAFSYNKSFNKLPIKLPIEKDNIYYRYVVRINKNVNSIISFFEKSGVEVRKPVFKPLHQYLGLDNKDFPMTEKVFKESLSLPIYPKLKEKEKEKVENILENFLTQKCKGLMCI